MISVIIPTYNAGIYIEEALNSVLGQTYIDYEVIVIDDGSIDNTQEIVESKFPMVNYIYTHNQGASRARNIGISYAKGDYVAFLDADDLWLPEKLEKQLAVFDEYPEVMLVFTESCSFDKNGFRNKPFLKKERLMKGDIVKNIFIHSYVGTPTVMIKKSVIDEIGFFEEDLIVAEDDNLWLRIAMKFKIALVDEDLVHCRIRENSLTTTPGNFFKGVNDHIELLYKKYPKITEHVGKRLIQKKKSECYYSQGYFYFSEYQFKLARKMLVQSFFILPQAKSIFFWACSFLPDYSIKRLKVLKRQMKISIF